MAALNWDNFIAIVQETHFPCCFCCPRFYIHPWQVSVKVLDISYESKDSTIKFFVHTKGGCPLAPLFKLKFYIPPYGTRFSKLKEYGRKKIFWYIIFTRYFCRELRFGPLKNVRNKLSNIHFSQYLLHYTITVHNKYTTYHTEYCYRAITNLT